MIFFDLNQNVFKNKAIQCLSWVCLFLYEIGVTVFFPWLNISNVFMWSWVMRKTMVTQIQA